MVIFKVHTVRLWSCIPLKQTDTVLTCLKGTAYRLFCCLIHLLGKCLKGYLSMRHNLLKHCQQIVQAAPSSPLIHNPSFHGKRQNFQHSGLLGYVRNITTVLVSYMSKISLFSSSSSSDLSP